MLGLNDDEPQSGRNSPEYALFSRPQDRVGPRALLFRERPTRLLQSVFEQPPPCRCITKRDSNGVLHETGHTDRLSGCYERSDFL